MSRGSRSAVLLTLASRRAAKDGVQLVRVVAKRLPSRASSEGRRVERGPQLPRTGPYLVLQERALRLLGKTDTITALLDWHRTLAEARRHLSKSKGQERSDVGGGVCTLKFGSVQVVAHVIALELDLTSSRHPEGVAHAQQELVAH
eukprot:3422334-Prymnesium_polylepis.1